jgi:acetoacetate decarboxylase
MTVPNSGFIPFPHWAPSYPDLPSIFTNCTTVGILARAPHGVLQRLTAAPLTAVGDLFQVNFLLAGEVRGATEPETPFLRDCAIIEFGVPVEFEGLSGGHCILEYTNHDDAEVIGRELWGWPKKFANILWQENADGFHFEAARNGVTLIDADFTYGEPDAPVGEGWPDVYGVRDDTPYLQVRHTIGRGGSTTSVTDVISVPVPGVEIAPSRSGVGSLRLFDGVRDPLSILGPVEILGARVDRTEFEFGYGEIVKSFEVPTSTLTGA